MNITYSSRPVHLFHSLLLTLFLLFTPHAGALTLIDSRVDGLNGVNGLDGASDVVISPNDQSVYVSGFTDNAVAIFNRNTGNGQLTFFGLVQEGSDGVSGLSGPSALAISPDGAHVYVASTFSNAVTVFSRNAATGLLTFVETLQNGTNGVSGLGGATDVAVSPDGTRVYVSGSTSGALAAFSRNTNTGALSFLAVQQNGTGGITGLNGAQGIAISADSQFIYVAASSGNSVSLFQRGGQELGFIDRYTSGQGGVSGLLGASDIVISPDGQQVYVASDTNNAVAAFSRNTGTGLLGFLTFYQDGVNGIDGLFSARRLAISADGENLYVSGTNDNAIAVFNVVGGNNPLSFDEAVKNNTDNISRLAGPSGITVSSDSHHVYVSAVSSDAINIFGTTSVDLQLSMSGDTQVEINTPLTYSISLSNPGTIPATNVTLTDTLPAEVLFVSATPSQGGCSQNVSTIICNLGTVTNATPVTISIVTVAPGAPANLNNTATVTANEADINSANNSATVATSVQTFIAQADVGVQVTATPSVVNVNTPLTFDVVVSNTGPDSASNVQLNATLSSSLNLSAVAVDQQSCTATSGQAAVSCAIGDLPAGATFTAQISLSSLSVTGTFDNTFTVSANELDNNTANNTNITPVGVATLDGDLRIVSAIANPTTVNAGETINYVFNIDNLGPDNVDGITLSLSPNPTGSIRLLSSSSDAPGAPNSPCTEANGRFSCALGILGAVGNPGSISSATVNIAAEALLPGIFESTASVAGGANDADGANNIATLTNQVDGDVADLSIVLETTPAVVAIGSTLTYTATITNNGSGSAVNPTFSATLPASVGINSVVASQGNCTIQGTIVNCTLEDIASEAIVTVTVASTPTATGLISATANVDSDTFDPNTSNNNAELTTNVSAAQADIQVTASADPDPVLLGAQLTYTVNVNNLGPNDATNLILTGNIPDGTTLVGTTSSQGSNCTEDAGVIGCALGALANGATATVTIGVTPDQTGVLLNDFEAFASEADPNAANNAASIDARVNTPPSLQFVTSYQNGTNGITGLSGVTSLALTPQHLYAAGFRGNAVVGFSRDPVSGELSFLQSIINGQEVGGVIVQGLTQTSSVTLSDDGSQLYATGFGENSLVVFSRNSTSGLLSPIQTLRDGVGGIDSLAGPFSVVSRGNFVYTAASGSDAVSVFMRGTDGILTRVGTAQNNVDGVLGLNGVNDLTISPDGLQLYAVSSADNALTIFNRNAETGLLSFVQTLQNGVGGVSGLLVASGVAVSADGISIYVAGNGSSAIGTFRRDIATGAVTFVEALAGVAGTNGVSGLVVSPDGTRVYAAATNGNALAVFSRDTATGQLTQLNTLADDTDGVNGLAGIIDVVIGANGDQVYTAGLNDDAVGLFRLPVADVSLTLNASNNQVTVGDAITYTVTVVNNGPDTATAVSVLNRLPTGLTLLSATPTQGPPCLSADGALICNIGTLDASATVSITVVTTAVDEGMLTYSAEVSANERDPNTTNNATQTIVEVTGIADLQINLQASPSPVAVGGILTYTATVVNAGPQPADNVVLTQALPGNSEFISVTTQQGSCSHNANTTICQLGILANQAATTINISVEPLQTGTISAQVSIESDDVDSDTSNNTASVTTQVSSNVISTAVDNTGGVLRNQIITSTGSVTGGELAGFIDNQGLIQNVTILQGAVVSGGGRLAGSIINEGIIENAQLAPNTIISGSGILRGNISGDPTGPALISGVIGAGAQISHVTISAATTLQNGVVIGTGVRFVSTANIPNGLDLTAAMDFIFEPVTNINLLNLSSDILQSDGNLLASMNAMPIFASSGLNLVQTSQGYIFLQLDDTRFSFNPTRLRQVTTPSDLLVQNDGSLQFITEEGREITAQPALLAPAAMRSALNLLGLTDPIQANANGNVSVPFGNIRFSLRPDFLSLPADASLVTGLNIVNSSRITNGALIVLAFDSGGVFLQQTLYPAAANSTELLQAEAISQLTLSLDGLASFVFNGFTQVGVFDYVVNTGGPTGTTSVTSVPDANGDGINDFRIDYANGEQQLFFRFGGSVPVPMTPSDLLSDIRAIPGLEGITIDENLDGNLVMTLAGEQRTVLDIGAPTQAPDGSQPLFLINADESIVFITPSERQVLGQPLIQDFAGLENALGAVTAKSNGDLSIAIDVFSRFAARPALLSSLSSAAIGLRNIAGPVQGLELFVITFLDEQNIRREQVLYPAPVNRDDLRTFFESQFGATGVTFHADGRLEVNGGSQALTAVFDYGIDLTVPGIGILLLESISDANGDGIEDFAVTYADGGRQLIYQLP